MSHGALDVQSLVPGDNVLPLPSGGPRDEYVYDNDGTRLTARKRSGYSRRIGTSADENFWSTRETAFQYDSSGKRTFMDVSAGTTANADVEFTYHSLGGNNAGQLHEIRLRDPAAPASMKTVLTLSNYDSFGNARTLVDENGVATHRVFDSQNRLERIVVDALGAAPREIEFDYLDNDRVCRLTAFATAGTGVYSTTHYGTSGQYSGSSTACDPASIGEICDTQAPGAGGSAPSDSEVATRQSACLAALGTLGRRTEQTTGAFNGAADYDFSVVGTMYEAAGRATIAQSSRVVGSEAFLERKLGMAYSVADALLRTYEKFTVDEQIPISTSTRSHDALDKSRIASSLNLPTTIGRKRSDYDYDALGRLVAVNAVDDSSGLIELLTTYGYDPAGNLSYMNRGGKEYHYLYDDFGALTKVVSPDSGTTRYFYDSSGLLHRAISDHSGVDVEFQYDVRGRLVKECFAGSCSSTSPEDRDYVYDSLMGFPAAATCSGTPVTLEANNLVGRLASATHENGTTYYSYNAFGEIVAAHEQIGTTFSVCDIKTTRYRRDGAGRVTELVYPSGRIVQYAYANSVYPTAVKVQEPGSTTFDDFITGLSFASDGKLLGYTSGAVTFSAAFDLSGQATTRTYSGATGQRYAWSATVRDGAGNIETLKDIATEKTYTYTYDIQSRIDSGDGSNVRGLSDCTWQYDPAGNRTDEVCFGKDLDYDYLSMTNNTLSGVSWTRDDLACADPPLQSTVTLSFDMDTAGRRRRAYPEKFPVSASMYTDLAYDSAGRLETVDGGVWEYQYDHRNLRRSKLGSETADFIYDQEGRMLHEERAGISYDYVYLAGHLVAIFEDESASTTDYVVATDHLRAPQRIFDRTTGQIKWASDYDPFGRANVFKPESATAPTLVFNLRGSNQYFDAETGLHQNWYRFYDPNTGRYISEDPLLRSVPGFDQPAYAFVENNPTARIDPDGRCLVVAGILAGEAAADAAVAALAALLVLYGMDGIDELVELMNEDSSLSDDVGVVVGDYVDAGHPSWEICTLSGGSTAVSMSMCWYTCPSGRVIPYTVEHPNRDMGGGCNEDGDCPPRLLVPL
ncbi:MAG: RHS repeat-associated core domain-containing protein [Myxococcota bacterium]